MKKCILLLLLLALFLSSCSDNKVERITQWPFDAFSFMENIPQFPAQQHDAVISEDFETVSIYYKGITLNQTYAYIEQLKTFGLEEYVSTGIEDGKFHWISVLEEGKLFAEVMWYDTEFELESGEYKYSLVLKFAEY